jgi:hypothetical protein
MGAEIMCHTIKLYACVHYKSNMLILRVWLCYWRTLRYDSDNTNKKKSTNSTWLGCTWANYCYVMLVLIQAKLNLTKIIMRHTYVRTVGKIMPSQSQLAFYTTFHASNINEVEQKLNSLHVQNIACITYYRIVGQFKYQTAKY